MASSSSLFKPNTSGAGLGQKKTEHGQFVNPPAYPESSGFTGPSKTAERNVRSLERTPSARKGKV